MKISKAIFLQATVWISIWLVFIFVGDTTNRPDYYNWVTTFRVVLLIIFYNLAYYGLLPLYFSGKKRFFFLLSILLFVAYIGLSMVTDLKIDELRKEAWDQTERGRPFPERPWVFMIMPPFIIGLGIFGVAATSRGFAAFEQKKKSEEEANRQRLEAEIALLKSQINPHFLLNTLNNLYAISLTDPDKTPDALFKLSEMVSYILYECASPRVSLTRDLEFVASYISLQRLRIPPNVELQVDLPKNPAEDLEIEPMILIPFIENAFKHGLTAEKPCEIDISIKLEGQHLFLKVENQVFPSQNVHRGNPSGIGMANTRQRLEHSYREKYRLDIEKNEEAHRVKLDINLEP